MMRSILVAVAATAAVLVTTQGCGVDLGVGDPCTPEQEFNTTFSGFSEKEVSVESKSFQCQTRLCLVNHFRGRVSCPYGQDSQGAPPSGVDSADPGAKGCYVPGFKPADGDEDSEESQKNKVAPDLPAPLGNCVASQCEQRKAENAVYCSCRCANLDGKTDDGAVYCECPEGFACTQLVSSIGGANEGLTGSYCIKNNTEYKAQDPCTSLDTSNPSKCVQ